MLCSVTDSICSLAVTMSEWKKAVGVVTQLVLSLKPLLITFFLDRNPRLTKEKQGSKRQIGVVYTRNSKVSLKINEEPIVFFIEQSFHKKLRLFV
jgi:hypothetical protein